MKIQTITNIDIDQATVNLNHIHVYPFVSVVIPMYNSAADIPDCLSCLLNLDYPTENLEIIVVNNGSTDGSREIAEKYPVKIIDFPDGTIGGVRNEGVRHAKGEIIAFVDSDCCVRSNWLQEALKMLVRPDVAVTGNGYQLPANATWFERTWLLENRGKERSATFIPSGNMLVKAEIFKNIGGFDASYETCEDVDLCHRIVSKGFQVIMSPTIESVHMRNPKNIRNFFKKEIWYGTGMMNSISKEGVTRLHLMVLLFFISHILLFIPTYSIWGLCAVSAICIGSSLYRINQSKKISTLPGLTILYYVYFLARGLGIAKSILPSRRTDNIVI